jgi:hypothetical protein
MKVVFLYLLKIDRQLKQFNWLLPENFDFWFGPNAMLLNN